MRADALTQAGCARIFIDTISGAKTERKGPADARVHLRRGDTLVALHKRVKSLRSVSAERERLRLDTRVEKLNLAYSINKGVWLSDQLIQLLLA